MFYCCWQSHKNLGPLDWTAHCLYVLSLPFIKTWIPLTYSNQLFVTSYTQLSTVSLCVCLCELEYWIFSQILKPPFSPLNLDPLCSRELEENANNKASLFPKVRSWDGSLFIMLQFWFLVLTQHFRSTQVIPYELFKVKVLIFIFVKLSISLVHLFHNRWHPWE